MSKTIVAITGLITAITQLIGVLAEANIIPPVPRIPFKILPKAIQGENPFQSSGMSPNHILKAKVLTTYIDEYASNDIEALAKFWDSRSSIREE